MPNAAPTLSPHASRLARAAARYAAAGWHIFPLPARQKRPFPCTRGLYEATADIGRTQTRWRAYPDSNIGLWPGPSGLLVIDLDGPDAFDAAARLGLLDVETLTCTTGREDGGAHRYFRHPGGTVGNVHLAPKIDVRCDAGYVLLPPSVHPSGRRYTWQNPRAPIAELPDAARRALLEATTRDAAVDARAEQTIDDAAGGTPTGEEIDRRVQAYLARVGTVGEGDRNNAAFRVAAWLTHDMALDDATALAYLRDWNAGNTPPLPSHELRAALHSASRHGRRARGSGRDRGGADVRRAASPASARLLRMARPSRSLLQEAAWQDD